MVLDRSFGCFVCLVPGKRRERKDKSKED